MMQMVHAEANIQSYYCRADALYYSAAFCTYSNCTAFGNALHFYYTILTFTVLYTVQYYSANCSNVFSCIFVLCCFV